MKTQQAITILAVIVFLLGACSVQRTEPTPDVGAAVATALAQTRTFEDAVATSIAATLAAGALAAPTNTPVPATNTPEPPPPPTSPAATTAPPPPTQAPTAAATVPKVVIAESDVDGDDGNDFLRSSSDSNQGRVVLLPGFQQSEVTRPMIFRDRIVFRVEVFDTRVGLYDGSGIQHVTFRIVEDSGNGQVVHERTERNPGYCVFGGGEPDCDVLVFAQTGNRWPDGREIRNGSYQAVIDIVPAQGEPTQWRWFFNIEIPGQSGSESPPQPNTARINSIRVEDGRYTVDFETFGFEPLLPGQHVHFFFNTVPPDQAGVPGGGPWQIYPAGPGQPNTSPFTLYDVNQRPPGATQICILVANPDHSVNPGTGNCVDLP
jgi:hypothetical protein